MRKLRSFTHARSNVAEIAARLGRATAWLSAAALLATSATAGGYADRFVWVFGWGLGQDADVPAITRVLDTAARHGLNGAVVSFGLDALCQRDAAYFRRLAAVQQACAKDQLALIPSLFSIGYGGGILAHNRNLAEGLGVKDAPFLVTGNQARLIADPAVQLANGGFEDFTGNQFKGFSFIDQPGEVSFADTEVRHSGRASLRLEHFTANPSGHGRASVELRVQPHRCYRLALWVKTAGLEPPGALRVVVLAGERELAPRQFNVPATTDWRKLTMLFNSLTYEKVRLYAGVWGAKAGRLWLDDWSVEEVGPINVLRRPGTPVTVRSDDGATTYVEGQDYAPLHQPQFSPYRVDLPAVPLELLPASRIRDGQRLRVSWYHPMLINDSQVTVCMGEPEVYEIIDHEAKLLVEHLHPRAVMLNMDEVRMGGTCRACAGRNMGRLLGECITKQAQAIRRYAPDARVYVWSDMLDPNHNAHGNYYLVQGDYTGSWNHVPRDLVIAVWGGAPRPKSLQFFAAQGFPTLVSCYYDADDLTAVKGWLDLARTTAAVRGFMYTPWQKKYALLPAFGGLVSGTPEK